MRKAKVLEDVKKNLKLKSPKRYANTEMETVSEEPRSKKRKVTKKILDLDEEFNSEIIPCPYCKVRITRDSMKKHIRTDHENDIKNQAIIDLEEERFNKYVHEIVYENDDKNPMVLDNFQPEHDNPCNDEGSKKEKNESKNESVDIIEKDKSDNDLPKQVASGNENGAKQDDDEHDITDKTIEKILPILEENKIEMQEPNKHAPLDESANPQHDKMGAKQDNDKYDTSEGTIEKILPIMEENDINKVAIAETIESAEHTEVKI